MNQQTIEDLKFVNQKFFRNTASWKKILNFVIEYGLNADKKTSVVYDVQLTKEEEDRVNRLCNFMADMISKYGKVEVLKQINEAIQIDIDLLFLDIQETKENKKAKEKDYEGR